jgi:hypothetical protein
MSKMKTKINLQKYNAKEENPTQLGLIWRTYYSRYEIGIKKIKKKDLVKKDQSSIKKMLKKTELTQVNFTNPLSE